MSNLYRGPSKDAFQQISIHLGKQFQRRLFRNQQIRNKNDMWRPYLLTDRDEMSNLHRAFHRCFLPSFALFERVVSEEKIYQKSTNQKQKWSVVAMFVNGSELNEQSLQKTIHKCFLASFDSFGQAVSEETIFRNQPTRNKNCLQWPCLLTNGDEISNLY